MPKCSNPNASAFGCIQIKNIRLIKIKCNNMIELIAVDRYRLLCEENSIQIMCLALSLLKMAVENSVNLPNMDHKY